MEKVVLEVDKQDQVAKELESLEKKYLRLVIDAQLALEAANQSLVALGKLEWESDADCGRAVSTHTSGSAFWTIL